MSTLELPYETFSTNGEAFILQYEDATKWLESLKLPYDKSRFRHYHDSIKFFHDQIKSLNNTEDKIDEFYDFLNSYAEAAELMRLKKAFSSREHEEFITQLKKVTSGQRFRNLTQNDPSRDFSFELSTAARFINAGYETSVNQIADIETTVDHRKIFIECKRIKSKKKLKDRVKSANTQLKKRLANNKISGSRGISAINVTDILNPEYNFIVADSMHEVKQSHSRQLEAFVRDNEFLLRTKNNRKIIGLLCEYNLYGYIRNEKPFDVFNCRGIKFLQYDTNQLNNHLTKKIAVKISNQNLV